MKKLHLVLTLITLIISPLVKGQNNTYFTGLGRALFTIDQMSDEVDPVGKQRASSGYTLYDFGFNFENKGLMRAGAIVRLRNEFGGFFGDGTSLGIRQVQWEGIIGNRVKYEIGDIYLSQTPYTLWNFNESYIDFESDLFKIRRDIINYENFFIKNNWRVQGANTSTKINFMKGINSLGLQAYGARLVPSDLINTPDRFIYGGRVEVVQSKHLKVGGNVVGISDIVGTVDSAAVEYHNTVSTVDFNVKLNESKKIRVGLNGEAGTSSTSLMEASTSTDKSKSDFFYDIGATVKYAPKNFVLGVSYRNVGPDFNSPGAQTRRIIESPANYTLEAFPNFNDGTTLRPMTMLDRLSQESGLYNNAISTTLLPYLPEYNNIEPYGQATPNRTGVSAYLNNDGADDLVRIKLGADALSEIYSAGDTATRALRSFTGFHGGVAYQLGKTIGWKKDLILKVGGRYENTQRDGRTPIDLQSTILDFGINVEAINNLHLLAGAKVLNAKGNEALVVRNRFNEVTSATNPVRLDRNEKLVGVGFRYDFANTVFFSTQYLINNYQSKLPGEENNTFITTQWFFLFNLSF